MTDTPTYYDKLIARTGRVQSWIDNPKSRLPVSCTTFVVEDSMDDEDGIEESWRFVSYALRHGAGVAVHLSKLRPMGSTNSDGLVASGPVSFAKIYSTLNEILRRGGVYKNGAVVCHLDLNHPDIIEFVEADRASLPWVKRCVDLRPVDWYQAPAAVKDAVLSGIARGDIWLNKIKYDQMGERIYGNVCLEVYLPHRGTCLLQHVNLGRCRTSDLRGAFMHGMRDLIELHGRTGVGKDGHYLDPTYDRQIGLGILGLANFLAIEGLTYHDLAQAFLWSKGPAADFVDQFKAAVHAAGDLARKAGFYRAFAIAPTATCSYRYTDRFGFTTCPEIAPPISRDVDRDSDTFGVNSSYYGPGVETASQVGWDDYFAVANGICNVLESTGLFHGYSFNSWSDVVTYDYAFIDKWLNSPQTSLYYSLQVMEDTQDKSDVLAALDLDLFPPVGKEFKPTTQTTKPIECIGCAE